MRIIISGGSGLIGRALTEFLLADDYEVQIISRNPHKLKNLPKGVSAISWDQKELTEHMEGADAVVNLVGASIGGDKPLNKRWTLKRKKQITGSRVDGGKRITEAIQFVNRKPRVLIQQSGVGYYGALGDEIVDEAVPNGTGFLAEVSQHWEASTNPVEAMGVRRVVTRTGVVFTPRDGIFSLFKLPFTFFFGGRLGSGQQYLSWIHIDDLLRAYRFLLENESAQGIFNTTSPDPVTNAEFANALGKAMRRPSLVPAPAFAIKLALGEASTLILDGQRVVPARLLEAGYQFKYKNLEDALSSLL